MPPKFHFDVPCVAELHNMWIILTITASVNAMKTVNILYLPGKSIVYDK